jgi:chromosome segregation protein
LARPPGKRNSTIHLLSGGEKALTAVALIFSIFELNPAPFCMLDEVDAPLDDTNVERFCDIVREMSDRVQFVVITHNKRTIELATHLTGVTMQEAGVSRLVAVDVEEAVRLAAT